METLRTDTAERVRTITLTRADAYNTITPQLRDELGAALDDADDDDGVHVILLRAEGKAFCAGYGLDWSTAWQAGTPQPERTDLGEHPDVEPAEWTPLLDEGFIAPFVEVFAKLWHGRKPTIAAVQGWCLAGGTDLVLCADLIVAADDATFGYPPARVWGIPTNGLWTHRLGVERAKRYLLTGDEIPAAEAARIGMILETVPAAELDAHSFGLAARMARLPLNQLVMLKRVCNQPVEATDLAGARRLGMLYDGIARHTPEGRAWVARAQEVGFRAAVRERDDPFKDYGSRG